MAPLRQRTLPDESDVLAPDGSRIRLLVSGPRGSMVHCELPAGGTSLAVTHRTVEEVWYVLAGRGELWRRTDDEERVDVLISGLSCDIPLGTHFQFRNTGTEYLQILIVTMPPWPGYEEAARVPDHWPVSADEGLGPGSESR